MLAALFGLALAPAAALAHFTLEYPTSRGFAHDDATEFCGGFDDASSDRTAFPINGTTSIAIDASHNNGIVGVLISFEENPTSFDDFQDMLLFNYTEIDSGVSCMQVDTSILGQDVEEGTNATIQIQYNGGDGQLFACGDITFSQDAGSLPDEVTCDAEVESSDIAAASEVEDVDHEHDHGDGDEEHSHGGDDDDSAALPASVVSAASLGMGLIATSLISLA